MAGNNIQLKRSSVAGRVPATEDVLVGEPVVNLTDKVIYTKDGGGNVIVIGAGITSNIAEGTNQYFTNARARSALTDATIQGNIAVTGNITASAISANTFVCGTGTGGSITGANLLSATYIQGNSWSGLYTANVVETSTELYFTNARVYSNVISIGYATNTNVALKANVVDLTTANVTEVTNLYFTNARAVAAFTAGDKIIIDANGLITANVTSGGGGASVTISNTAPLSAVEGDLYWDNELGRTFIYYGTQWVESSPASSPSDFTFSQSVGATATELYSFDKTLYRGGKFIITLSNDPNYKIEELLLIHDGNNVSLSNKYTSDDAVVIGSISADYTANIVSGNVKLYAAAITGSPTARGEVSLIEV